MAVDFRLKYITLDYDIYKGYVKGEVWGKQGETGKGLKVTLWDSGQMYLPDGNEVIRLSVLKPDGKRIWLNCDLFEDNLYFKLTSQLFSSVGIAKCEFEIVHQGVSKKSDTFDIEVKESMSYGAVETMEIDINTIKIGTLASPPIGISKGEVWADATSSVTDPILRIKL